MAFGLAARLVTLLLGVSIYGCVPGKATSGGESNWLRACDSESDCQQGTCICGLCTATCSKDSQCHTLGGGACVPLDTPPLNGACDSEPKEPGLCLASCSRSRECPSGERCSAGSCVPSAASGSAARDASVDGGSRGDGVSCPDAFACSDLATLADAASDAQPSDAGASAATNLAGTSQFDAAVPGADAPSVEACAYRYLGDWTGCSAGTSMTSSATTLADCMSECNATSDCIAIQDYSWLGPKWEGATCDLVIAAACDPIEIPLAESLSYEKVCDLAQPGAQTIETWAIAQPGPGYTSDPASECHFEWSGAMRPEMLRFVCEGYGMTEFESSQGQTLDECFATCEQDSNCKSVLHWRYEASEASVCVTYVGPCDALRTTTDEVSQFAKVCATP